MTILPTSWGLEGSRYFTKQKDGERYGARYWYRVSMVSRVLLLLLWYRCIVSSHHLHYLFQIHLMGQFGGRF
jgi:hypothetical protein